MAHVVVVGAGVSGLSLAYRLRQTLPISPFFFDCLYLDGSPLIDEPLSRRVAVLADVTAPDLVIPRIVTARAEGTIETTARLAEIVRSVKWSKPGQIDPATLTFQALRIAANEELVGLDQFISDAVEVLESGARIAVIAFHSLEDRIVKRAFRRLEGQCTCPPNLPVCVCGAKEIVKVLTHRPQTPGGPRAPFFEIPSLKSQ